MASEVQLWVAECEQCNRRKTPLGTTKAPMKSIKVGATYEVMGNGHPWPLPVTAKGKPVYLGLVRPFQQMGGSR